MNSVLEASDGLVIVWAIVVCRDGVGDLSERFGCGAL